MTLTTNRITSRDIAVQLRIHLAIRYDDLTREQKQNVFNIFLDQLRPESIKEKQSILDFINEWGMKPTLSGTINAIERLTARHLKQVLTITKDFQEQLESITMDQRNANEAARS